MIILAPKNPSPKTVLPQSFSQQGEDIVERVYKFICSSSLDFFSGNFFSSKQFYQTVQVTLLVSSGVGVIGSATLLIMGMQNFSFVMLALSATTAVGAYIAHLASTQQSLTESVEKNQRQSDNFQVQNTTLRKHLEVLGRDVNTLALETSRNEEVHKMLFDRFEAENQQNSGLFQASMSNLRKQSEASYQLVKELSKERDGFKKDSEEQLKILKEITDPQHHLDLLKKYDLVVEALRKVTARLEKAKQELSDGTHQLSDVTHQLSEKKGQLVQAIHDLEILKHDLETLREEYRKIIFSLKEQNKIFAENNATHRSILGAHQEGPLRPLLT